MVSAGHISAGPSIHAWVGLTLVVVDVTVGSTPARVAGAFVAKVQNKFTFLSFSAFHRDTFFAFCKLVFVALTH